HGTNIIKDVLAVLVALLRTKSCMVQRNSLHHEAIGRNKSFCFGMFNPQFG
ncbi:MAG: hypothetical protein ACJAU8_000149, partial [Candidatus Paceibacteria bacterium]